MQRQLNNQETKKFKVKNNKIYNISFYDLILLGIPVLFIISLLSSFIFTNISIQLSLFTSSLLSIIIISYCLFFDSNKFV